MCVCGSVHQRIVAATNRICPVPCPCTVARSSAALLSCTRGAILLLPKRACRPRRSQWRSAAGPTSFPVGFDDMGPLHHLLVSRDLSQTEIDKSYDLAAYGGDIFLIIFSSLVLIARIWSRLCAHRDRLWYCTCHLPHTVFETKRTTSGTMTGLHWLHGHFRQPSASSWLSSSTEPQPPAMPLAKRRTPQTRASTWA